MSELVHNYQLLLDNLSVPWEVRENRGSRIRRRESQQLIENIQAHPVTILTGTSQAGKTSLVDQTRKRLDQYSSYKFDLIDLSRKIYYKSQHPPKSDKRTVTFIDEVSGERIKDPDQLQLLKNYSQETIDRGSALVLMVPYKPEYLDILNQNLASYSVDSALPTITLGPVTKPDARAICERGLYKDRFSGERMQQYKVAKDGVVEKITEVAGNLPFMIGDFVEGFAEHQLSLGDPAAELNMDSFLSYYQEKYRHEMRWSSYEVCVSWGSGVLRELGLMNGIIDVFGVPYDSESEKKITQNVNEPFSAEAADIQPSTRDLLKNLQLIHQNGSLIRFNGLMMARHFAKKAWLARSRWG